MSTIPSMEEQFTNTLTKIIKANFGNEQFCVTVLANEMKMSRATLHRKTKSITGQTVSQFINEVRLKEAKQLLENRSGTVSEIAYMVGFGSSNYFIKCFHNYYGYPPGKLLNGNHKKTESGSPQVRAGKKHASLYYRLSTIAVLMVLFIFAAAKLFNHKPGNRQSERVKVLSTNQAALNLYQQGVKLMEVYRGSIKEEHFLEAKNKFERAVQLDSTFGDAYVRIANIYVSHIPYSNKTNKGFNYGDSVRFFLNKAKHFGVVDEEYFFKISKNYYLNRGDYQQALDMFEKIWENKNKDYNFYLERGNFGFHSRNYTDGIGYTLKYLQLKPDSILPVYDRLQKLAILFSKTGMDQEAFEFTHRSFILYPDTIKYNSLYTQVCLSTGSFDKVVEIYQNAPKKGKTAFYFYKKLFEIYLLTGRHDDAMILLKEYENYSQITFKKSIPLYVSGYYHNKYGETELAKFHFENEIKRWENFCRKYKYQQSLQNYCTVAACYAMLNDKQGLVQSLEKLYQKTSIPYLVVLHLQRSPMFDNYRNDEDFTRLKTQIESKFYKERKTIEQLVVDFNLDYNHTAGKKILLSSQ